MITCSEDIDTVRTNGVLYTSSDAIRKMAIQMIVNAADSNTEMVCDMQNEYKTKEEIAAVYSNLAQQAKEMLEDHINDIKLNLEKFLCEAVVHARVRRLDYDEQGNLSDISVDIQVERR